MNNSSWWLKGRLALVFLMGGVSFDMLAAPPELERILKPPDKHKVAWTAPGGLLNAPRRGGFVKDKAYCRKNIPVLRKYLNDPSRKLRTRVAARLAELQSGDGFDILLDALQKERRPHRRGGHHYLFSSPGIADRVIALIGRPHTYDPLGTAAHRNAVIERWRRDWKAQGKSFLRGLAEHKPLAGKQTLHLGNERITKNMEDMDAWFYIAGRKLYQMGTMTGDYPPLARLLGDQSGIWALPIKVMDGLQFSISEEGQEPWMSIGCRDFEHDFASCTFNYSRNGLSVSRRDFIAENEPALFSTVTIRNETKKPRKITLQFLGLVNIRPAWGTAMPNDLDVIEYQDGAISAFDSGKKEKWGVVFGSTREPVNHTIRDNKGILAYSLKLPPSKSTELTFLVLAEPEKGVEVARKKFRALVGQAEKIWAQKKRLYEEKILSGVQFDCSDKNVVNAFKCAKANVLMMTADIRSCFELPFLLAGIPDYAELFANDSVYSTTGVCAGGFKEVAEGTLKALGHYARKQGGRVPHEVVPNGKIVSRGNVQETSQFVFACGQYSRWTKDNEFLKEIYPLCRQCIRFTLENYDRDNDMYPEGQGLMEVASMTKENIDAAVYLYAALDAMAGMAKRLGRNEESSKYRSQATDLKKRFNKDWWNAKERMWADALDTDGSQQMFGLPGVVFPMETGIADPEKADAALKRIRKDWVNTWIIGGKPWNGGFNTCPAHNNNLAIGAFNYGHVATGWERLVLTARVPLEFKMLGAYKNTAPGADDLLQLWCFGPYLEAVIMGLVGVHPVASEHRVEIFPQLPAELDYYSLRDIEIGEHKLDVDWKRDGKSNVFTIDHTDGPRDLNVLFRIASKDGRSMTVNGKSIPSEKEEFRGADTRKVKLSLSPGETATIKNR